VMCQYIWVPKKSTYVGCGDAKVSAGWGISSWELFHKNCLGNPK
jgi:hypothetical protein